MSTNIVGIKPASEKHKQMYEIYERCLELNISCPDEVDEYFGGETPDEKGVTLDLNNDSAVTEYTSETGQGYEVDLTKLSKDIKILRFYNSW